MWHSIRISTPVPVESLLSRHFPFTNRIFIPSLAPRGRMKNTLSFSPSLRGKEWQCIFHSSPRSEGRNEIFETFLGNLSNIVLKNDIVLSLSSGKYIAWGIDVKIKFCIKQFQRFSFEESCKSYILQRFSRQCFIDF